MKFDVEVNPILEYISSYPDSTQTREYAFRQAIDFYNRRKYFEAHEIFEFQWKKEQGNRKIFLQSLIQISVAMNKIYVNVNHIGALSQSKLALEKLFLLKSKVSFSKEKSAVLETLIENLKELIRLLECKVLDNADYTPPILIPELYDLVY